MNYEAVIGLEVHAQLLTRSKIFCGCRTAFGAEPNSQTCQVCIGMPGVLPVLNRKAVEFAVRTGLATDCKISGYSRFARKNYFYPDLPKGYQISQYELPICEHGHIDIIVEGAVKRIGITRIHMEEDAGKNIHEGAGGGRGGHSFVDLNRAGVPLMEIVSEPDLRSPAEAVSYMKKLRSILRYIGVSDGNMEQGSLRCDANVSVRPYGQERLGVKVEIKNINSFRFVERALEYEIKRQIKAVGTGKIIQETRTFDSDSGITEPMRSKEEAHDYRYFPEPDLVPITVDKEWVEEIKAALPELPAARMARFISDYGLPEYDADFLTSERALAEWFEGATAPRVLEGAAAPGALPKTVANWMMGDLMRLLNETNTAIEDCPIKPAQLAGLLKLIEDATISGKIAKTVFEEMFKTGRDADAIVREKGLVQITDEGAILKAIDDTIEKHPEEAARFRAGDEKLIGFFVGQVMKITKGKANPTAVNELLKKLLKTE